MSHPSPFDERLNKIILELPFVDPLIGGWPPAVKSTKQVMAVSERRDKAQVLAEALVKNVRTLSKRKHPQPTRSETQRGIVCQYDARQYSRSSQTVLSMPPDCQPRREHRRNEQQIANWQPCTHSLSLPLTLKLSQPCPDRNINLKASSAARFGEHEAITRSRSKHRAFASTQLQSADGCCSRGCPSLRQPENPRRGSPTWLRARRIPAYTRQPPL